MAKKKKKKKPAGARKPSYAQGKKVEPSKPKTGAATAKAAPAKSGQKSVAGGKGVSASEQPREQWNLIRRGTLEWKVYWTILVIIVVSVLLQYPLLKADADKTYRDLSKRYPQELKKWEQKYTTPKEQKAHVKEKPGKPRKPTFNDFLVLQAFFLVLESGILAFVGFNIMRRTDLKTPLLDSAYSGEGFSANDAADLLKYSVPFAGVALVPLVASSFVAKYMGAAKSIKIQYAVWRYALSYVSVSVQNQILFLLLMMSAFVWLFFRYRSRVKIEPHWAALGSTFLIATLYLLYVGKAAGDSWSVSALSSIFLAASVVLVLGYLYWKKGLEYSLLAGAIAFCVYPLLAFVIIK